MQISNDKLQDVLNKYKRGVMGQTMGRKRRVEDKS